MDTTIETLPLSFPAGDMKLVKELAKKFGWKLGKTKKSGLDEAIEDVKHGRVSAVGDIDEYFRRLGVQ